MATNIFPTQLRLFQRRSPSQLQEIFPSQGLENHKTNEKGIEEKEYNNHSKKLITPQAQNMNMWQKEFLKKEFQNQEQELKHRDHSLKQSEKISKGLDKLQNKSSVEYKKYIDPESTRSKKQLEDIISPSVYSGRANKNLIENLMMENDYNQSVISKIGKVDLKRKQQLESFERQQEVNAKNLIQFEEDKQKKPTFISDSAEFLPFLNNVKSRSERKEYTEALKMQIVENQRRREEKLQKENNESAVYQKNFSQLSQNFKINMKAQENRKLLDQKFDVLGQPRSVFEDKQGSIVSTAELRKRADQGRYKYMLDAQGSQNKLEKMDSENGMQKFHTLNNESLKILNNHSLERSRNENSIYAGSQTSRKRLNSRDQFDYKEYFDNQLKQRKIDKVNEQNLMERDKQCNINIIKYQNPFSTRLRQLSIGGHLQEKKEYNPVTNSIQILPKVNGFEEDLQYLKNFRNNKNNSKIF